MLNVCLLVTSLLSLAGVPLPPSQSTAPVDQAKALFTRFVELEQAYDIAVADLYADDAVIKNKRTYPTGEVRELTIPPAQYKQLLRQAMPLAKARGDRSTYSKCGYKAEGANVRISCSRYSELKKYTSPYTLLVGPGRAGKWQILEELSESRP
jgi:hypothetical protein